MSDLEGRVEALEQLVQSVAGQVDASDRLTMGVERLADETGGLNQILTKVDEQQQKLASLSRDVQRVADTSVTKDDLVDAKQVQAKTALEFRKKTLTRVYSTGILLALGLLLGLGGLLQYQQERRDAAVDACRARNAQNKIIIDILQGSIKNAPVTPATDNIRSGIARFQALIVDCDKL